MKVKFKDDVFRKNRGGYTRLLKVTCEKCGSLVCLYQKDGPGNLRRMYIDRINDSSVSIARKELLCANDHLLGIKTIYEKEKRPAFRLFVDAVVKKVVKA